MKGRLTPSPSGGWAAKVAAVAHRLYLLRFTPRSGEGAPMYYCILVNPAKEKLLLERLKGSDTLDLSQYGEIVASDYGEPPESLKAWLREKYKAEI